jgi:hypothetical protein
LSNKKKKRIIKKKYEFLVIYNDWFSNLRDRIAKGTYYFYIKQRLGYKRLGKQFV